MGCATPDVPPGPRRAGTIALGERIILPSQTLNESRSALVHLPDGYSATSGPYPVIYVLDGESHFLTAVAASRVLTRAGLMPDAIIVGIENVDRERDFTTAPTHPEAVPQGLGETGGADRFAEFIERELVPFVEGWYRAAPARVIVGHSLGGLVATHLLASRPELFRGYITLEPSLWWDRRAVADSVRAMLERTPSLRTRLVMVERGTSDGWIPDSAMLARVAPAGVERSLIVLEEVSHSLLPYQGFYDGFQRLFEGYEAEAATDPAKATVADLERQYTTLSEAFGYTVRIPESAFLTAAGRRMDARAPADAVAILARGAEVHPRSRTIATALAVAREASSAPGHAVNVPFEPVDAREANRLLGEWIEERPADDAAPAMRIEHRFEIRGDTLSHSATVIPGEAGPPPFRIAAMPVRIDGDTVRWERFNRGGGGYVSELRFAGGDLLVGTETGIGLPAPPPGVVNRPSTLRLARTR